MKTRRRDEWPSELMTFTEGFGKVRRKEAILRLNDLLGLVGACLLALCLGVQVSFAENMMISVGVPLPLKGPKAKFGEMHRKSYLMALEEINASGGIAKGTHARYKLEFLFGDTLGKADPGRKQAEKLISQDKVRIIMGGYSSAVSDAVAGVCEQNKIPFIVASGAADRITQQRRKFTFRINPPASEYTSGLREFFLNLVKPASMAILYEKTRFGASVGEAMNRWCEENGIEVVIFEPYEPWADDFRALLTMVYAVNPDVIFTTSRLMDAILLVKQLAELNIRPRLLAGVAGTFAMPKFLQGVGPLSENVISASVWIPNVKYAGAEKFASKYKGKYGIEPDYHGAEAYAAAYVCKDILERAKSLDARDLVAALKDTDMMTVLGPVKFVSYDKYRNQNKLSSLVVQIQNGRPATIWPPEATVAGFIHPAEASYQK